MKADEFSNLDWLEPWRPVPDGAELEVELRREVGRGHALFGREAVAVGRRSDNDDVLFLLAHGSPPLAVVHLTWRAEAGPGWPHTTFYSSLEEWISERMKADHAEASGAE